MMNDSLLKLKNKILDEMLEDLDSHEATALKPKAAVSITAVQPKEEVGLLDGKEPEPEDVGGAMPDDVASALTGKGEDDDDEDLKMLLEHYLGK